jgi:hypothetical protein
MPKRILKIGIELEGGWDKTFSDIVIQHDGSVHLPLTNHLGQQGRSFPG